MTTCQRGGYEIMRRRLGERTNPIRAMARGVRAGATRLKPLSERRKWGRVKGSRLGCNLGQVMDLSGGGLRLRSTRRLAGKKYVELWSHSRRVRVLAEVVWAKRLGFRRYELGLQFRDVDDETAKELTGFASYLRAG